MIYYLFLDKRELTVITGTGFCTTSSLTQNPVKADLALDRSVPRITGKKKFVRGN